MINGITVKLHIKTVAGEDGFGTPIMEDSVVFVDDVLVSPVSSEESNNDFAFYEKKTIYTLAIPKGDTHEWEDTEVEFFGKRFRTVGNVTEGIEANIPLKWNKQIKVEYYG